jgi:Tol biopolymer transport system component
MKPVRTSVILACVAWALCLPETMIVGASADANTVVDVVTTQGEGMLGPHRIPCEPGKVYLGGKALVFASMRAGHMDIFVMYPDGCGQQKLVKEPLVVGTPINEARYDGMPAWSKDRKRIAYATNRDSIVPDVARDDRTPGSPPALNFEVYVMNADGTGQTRLTTDAGTDWEPTWSADGRIAFSSTRAGNADIYVMNADGTGQTPLTRGLTGDSEPDWSPDGTKIAFVVNLDGNKEIFVMNADGNAQTRLTKFSGADYSPTWSPDGTKIAFTRVLNDNPEIYVMNSDGTGEPRQVTDNPGTDADPTWSPDGSRLAFTHFDEQTDANIYTIKLDGSGRVRLTSAPPFNGMPDWGRTILPQVNR